MRPGRLRASFAALGAALVPTLVAVAAFLTALAFVAWPLALLAAVVLAAAVVWVRSRVVRTRAGRWIWRAAVAVHVLFWSALGLSHSAIRPAGPVGEASVVDWRAAVTLRAGVATVPFDLPARATLAGWGKAPRRRAMPAFGGLGYLGRWTHARMATPGDDGAPRSPLFVRASGEGETLGARALVLVPDGDAVPLAFVRLELVVVSEGVVRDVLARVADLGFRAETLLIGASHTHSGPGGFHEAPLAQVFGTDHLDAGVREAVVAAAANAVRDAHAAALPARVAIARSRDRDEAGAPILARNRRGDALDIDDRAVALRVDEEGTNRTIAILLDYAVHPVLLRAEHGAFGRDLAGAVEDALGARFDGAPVLFLQGALGDVSPARGPEGEPRGAARARAMADAFADRVQDDLRAARAHPRLRVRASRVLHDLGTPYALLAAGSRDALADALGRRPFTGSDARVVADVLALPLNAVVWSLGLTEVRLGFTWNGSAGLIATLDRAVSVREHAFGAVLLDVGSDDDTAQERCTILWLPAEATTALGRRWKERADEAAPGTSAVMGLVGGSIAYATSRDEYDGSGYEAQVTLYGPCTADHAEDALFAALAAAQAGGDP